MKLAIEQLHENISRIRSLIRLHTYCSQQSLVESDASDVLRAAIVLLVSALDTFIHDLVRLGMVEILRGEREQTAFYRTFGVTMRTVNFDPHYGWFEDEIYRRFREESFYRPAKITEVIGYITDVPLWERLASEWRQEVELIQKHLQEIVGRRNRIAHESDRNPTVPDMRWPVDVESVNEAVDFIEKFSETIYQIVIDKR